MCANPSAIHRYCCVLVISLTVLGSAVHGAAADDEDSRERVILLTSGRILTGIATRDAGGWLVEQGGGRIHVPIEQVAFVAKNMIDAYRQQRDSVVEPTPATHMALAQWCLSYRLYDEARDELRKCLNTDPDHSAARKLLHRVEELLNPPTPKPAAPATVRTSDGFLVPEVESLGGLSNEAAVSFTQRIQPLLMNKCGNASCHGSTSRSETSPGFHLIAVRNGSNSHRIYSERNLAEVLRFVDINEPGLSPLAVVPLGAHAGTAGVFQGTSGNAQLKMLRTWIKTIATERLAQEQEIAVRPSIASKGRRPIATASTSESSAREADEGDFVVPSDVPAKPLTKVLLAHYTEETVPPARLDGQRSRERRTDPAPTASKEAAKAAVKESDKPSDDAFDPDVFNRRFHGNPR